MNDNDFIIYSRGPKKYYTLKLQKLPYHFWPAFTDDSSVSLERLTVRAPVDLIVVAPRKNVFFHNSSKIVVGHGLKDYGVKNLFTM